MAEREVVVNFETCESKVAGSGPSNTLQDSHEKSKAEFAQNRMQDIQNQQNRQQSSSHSREGILRCPSNAPVQQKSRKWDLSRTKYRLIDPPEESCLDSSELPGDDDDDDDVDVEDMPEVYKNMMISACTSFQLVCLAIIVAALVCNLCVSHLKRLKLWDLHLWEWEIMILVLICGHLLSHWATKVVVFLMERNFILRKRVLYFVYGVKNSVINCFWLGLVLLVWHFILINKMKAKVRDTNLVYVTKILLCLFVGTLIWLLKTILVKVFGLCFHVKAFFERIREALFKQYVIDTLSVPPSRENDLVDHGLHLVYVRSWRLTREEGLHKNSSVGNEPLRSLTNNKIKKQDEEIPLDQLHKLNKRNISAWNMKRMVNIARHVAFTTLDEKILNSDTEDEPLMQVRRECHAKHAAQKIFQNVAGTGSRYISLEDLMRFMRKEEALKTMDLLRAAYGGQEISMSSLTEWMVNALRERKVLAFSLKDTKTAVDELHNMLRLLVAIIILIVWLLIFGTPILHLIVFTTSQLLLAVFMFGNTCRMVFEAIIFLFIMHPFDVGDRCEVDGVQMLVEEVNILNTVFLRYDNQKIIYPNGVLASKPIINYRRSSDIGDGVDFCIHISTPLDKVAIMKRRITEYIERKNDHWHPAPMVIMKDVEELNKLNMSVWLTHKLNYQDIKERWIRRSQLIEEMIQVFRELNVEYHLLPLDVNVRNLPPMHLERTQILSSSPASLEQKNFLI